MLNYEFPPLGGGAGNATYYLLKEYSRCSDLKIDLVTSSDNKYKEEKFADNIRIYYLDIGKEDNLHHQSSKDLLSYYWKARSFCKKLCKKRKYDFIHSFFGVPCGYLALKLNLPYLVSLRGSDVPGHNPKFAKIYLFLGNLTKRVWSNAEVVVANSEDLKREAKEFLPMDFPVIPNGVDATYFKPANKKDDTFRILYVGRLHKIKNIDLLIKSFAEFAKNNPEVKSELKLVGDGPERQNLLRLAEDSNIAQSVKFLGRRNKKELLRYYQQASVFTLLSEREGMSNTALEAMACGLPVILSSTGSSNNLVRGNGIITEKEPKSVAIHLNKLSRNRDKLSKMGHASRQIAEKFSWEITAKQYYKIYRKLCAE